MCDCVFDEKCLNSGTRECDFCQYNPDACTQNLFEWNGAGEEPTEQELDDAIEN